MKFKFKNRFGFIRLLYASLLIGLFAALALPALAQVTPRALTTVGNFPSFIGASGVSNATVNSFTYKSNMIPVRPGKDLGLGFTFQQASNGQAAAVTHYFGFVYNRTNTSSMTNFSWIINANQTTAEQRVFTNIPSAVVGNADGVFWFSTQNAITNTITGTLIGQNSN